MNYKKIIIPIACVMCLSFSTVSFAKELNKETAVTEDINTLGVNSIKGKVIEVRHSDNGASYVLVSDDKNSETTFYINDDTYFLGDKKIEKDMIITGFYDLSMPAPAIFPPQYTMALVDTKKTTESYKVDKFNADMLSSDGNLKLNLDKDALIVDKEGMPYTKPLANNVLLVHYDITTRSIPPQTTPTKIVVLTSNQDVQSKNEGDYFTKSGTVESITNYKQDVLIKISFKSSDGSQDVNEIFVTNESTFFVDKIKVGDKIIGFAKNQIIPYIYPPKYTVSVVALEKADSDIKADKFDENLLSSDGKLKLTVSDTTEIVSQDGMKYTGELKNKDLVAIYSFTTKSLPPTAVPTKIIVLSDKPLDQYVINDKKINVIKVNDIDMISVRECADALGLKLVWDAKTKTIFLGSEFQMTVGINEYLVGNESTKLEVAPTLIEGKTYIPLSFFTKLIADNK